MFGERDCVPVLAPTKPFPSSYRFRWQEFSGQRLSPEEAKKTKLMKVFQVYTGCKKHGFNWNNISCNADDSRVDKKKKKENEQYVTINRNNEIEKKEDN